MTKRILSVLLALVLVLGLTIPAMAVELSVTDDDTRDYVAYQIFTGNYVEGVFVDAQPGANLDAAALAADLELTGEYTGTDLVEALAAKGLSGVKAAEYLQGFVTGDPTELPADLPVGYYLIEETTEGEDTISAFMLDVYTGTEIAPKRSDVPETNKVIVEGATESTYTEAAIGDIITFKISAVVPANYDKYDPYLFIFHDTMSEGLTYNNDAAVTAGDIEGDITFDAATNKLTVDFDDISKTSGLAGKEIVVTYTATLNDKAVVASTGNPNTFKVEYSNAPYVEGDGEEGDNPPPPPTDDTPEEEVVVFTLKVTGDKYDGSDATKATKLDGAEFVIANANQTKYLKQDAATKKITWVDDIADATVMVSADDGSFGIEGIDAGSYNLIETKAPAGYNKLTEAIPFTVAPEYNDTKTEVINDSGNVKLDVANNAGTVLPSTGGIGTTIFYVIGGLLMAAAVVLLVAKKRTVNE